MKSDNNLWRLATDKNCGIGGWRCPCCGPKTKDRQKIRRGARRRIRNKDRNTLFREMGDNPG